MHKVSSTRVHYFVELFNWNVIYNIGHIMRHNIVPVYIIMVHLQLLLIYVHLYFVHIAYFIQPHL